MGKLIDEGLLQEKLALIPMEERTFRRTVEELENASPVEAIPKDQINKAIEKIEQYICDVETDTVKAQGMAQALDMFEQTLGGLEDGIAD